MADKIVVDAKQARLLLLYELRKHANCRDLRTLQLLGQPRASRLAVNSDEELLARPARLLRYQTGHRACALKRVPAPVHSSVSVNECIDHLCDVALSTLFPLSSAGALPRGLATTSPSLIHCLIGGRIVVLPKRTDGVKMRRTVGPWSVHPLRLCPIAPFHLFCPSTLCLTMGVQ